jgi:uncharacterized repeat protein (TIGR03803 family)
VSKFAIPVFCAAMTGAAEAVHPAEAAKEALVYSFKGGTDGANPSAPLIDVGGILYGTTGAGGSTDKGTVFSVTRAGVENVLYSFQGDPDGSGPAAGLVYLKGEFYGTTSEGGGVCLFECGTVFAVSKTGVERVVYAFLGPDGNDGYRPYTGLTLVGGDLYGTTSEGGSAADGTVFKVTPSGTETIIYSFQGGADGSGPSGLINVKGTLYGTTGGGAYGYGTVFSVTPSGAKTTLYQFQGGADGSEPNALTRLGGRLYGTTANGGTSEGGTVFEIGPNGAHKVIYSFKGYSDGANPLGTLLNVGGTLYGTTEYGGTLGQGAGTVFAVTPSGNETVLHAFLGGNDDGLNPVAGLIDVKGILYGTTPSGGSGGNGQGGTVFKVKP